MYSDVLQSPSTNEAIHVGFTARFDGASSSGNFAVPEFSKAHPLHRYRRFLCSSFNKNELADILLAKESTLTSNDYPNSEQEEDADTESIPKASDSNGSQLIIKFKLDPSLVEQRFQKAYDNHILLLLSMSAGQYPVQLYKYQPRLQASIERFLKDWILSKKLSYSSSGYVDLGKMTEIKHTFFIGAPLLLKSSEKFRLFLKFAVCQWIMDDFMAKSVSSGQVPFLSPAFYRDLRKIVTNILSSQYRHVDAVPYFDIPLFHHCLTALFEVHQEIRETVGFEKYDKYHGPLLQEMIDWIEWHKINAYTFGSDGCDVGEERRYFSQRTDFERLRFFRGRGAILEIIQLLHGAAIENSLRSLKIFGLFCDTAVVIHTMAMEVFSKGNVDVKPSAVETINDAIVDFKRIEENLRREYETNERVLRFVRNVQCFVDGCLRALVDEWQYSKAGSGNNGEMTAIFRILELQESK